MLSRLPHTAIILPSTPAFASPHELTCHTHLLDLFQVFNWLYVTCTSFSFISSFFLPAFFFLSLFHAQCRQSLFISLCLCPLFWSVLVEDDLARPTVARLFLFLHSIADLIFVHSFQKTYAVSHTHTQNIIPLQSYYKPHTLLQILRSVASLPLYHKTFHLYYKLLRCITNLSLTELMTAAFLPFTLLTNLTFCFISISRVQCCDLLALHLSTCCIIHSVVCVF